MVKNTAQEADETTAEVVVVSDGLREKRKVETGEKAEKRAGKGKPLEGFLYELIRTESISFRSKKQRSRLLKAITGTTFFIGYQGKYKTEFDATCKMMVYKKMCLSILRFKFI